jgi:DNA polymerase-3 subunit delta'
MGTPLGVASHFAAGFDRIVNQELAKSVLASCLATGRFPSLLFAGPEGVGKRTLALLFAQALNCTSSQKGTPFRTPNSGCGECADCRQIANLTHPDVRLVMPLKPEPESDDGGKAGRDSQRAADETLRMAPEFGLAKSRPTVESKWQISISVILSLRREMAFAPIRGRRRVVIMLDADQMNPISANAFLKTLEEPQRDTTFILVTERSHKLPDTIRSRCQIVRFSFLPQDEIVRELVERHGTSRDEALIAAEISGGSLRRALNYQESPDDFLAPVATDFFVHAQPTIEDCRSLVEQADRASLAAVIDSLLFLYGQALHVSLGRPAHYARQNQAVLTRSRLLAPQAIGRRLEILLRARRESDYNVNKRLFLFSLLTMLAGSR